METLRHIVPVLKRIEFCNLVIYYENNNMLERVKLLKLSKRDFSDVKTMLKMGFKTPNQIFLF